MHARIGLQVGCLLVVGGIAVPALGDHPRSHAGGKFTHFNRQEVQRITEEIQEGDFNLADAISNGQGECDGMAIAARGRLVRPREYARMLRVGDDLSERSGNTVVFEVACAPRDPQGNIEAVAVLPATGEVLPFKGMEFRTVAQRERNPYSDFGLGEFDEEREMYESGHMKSAKLCKASKIIGTQVRNLYNEDLGEIEDLAIDTRTGRIRYVVLDTGGRFDTTDEYFAIPIKAFSPGAPGVAILNVPSEEFQYAEGFEADNWPLNPDPRWTRLTAKYEGEFFDRGTHTGATGTLAAFAGMHPAKARRVARGLFENSFTLTDAVKYVEGKQNCHAIAACAKQDTETRASFEDTNLFVEVACHRYDEPNTLQLVSVSPRTGNIIRTREITLTAGY